jgi:hypothetical protein
LCTRADAAYRQAASTADARRPSRPSGKAGSVDGVALRDVGVALKAAMLDSMDIESFRTAIGKLRSRHPDITRSLGL